MTLCGIRLRLTGPVLYYDSAEFDLDIGDRVIVDVEGESMEGEVVIAPSQVIYSEVPEPLISVLRRVEDPDLSR